MFSDLLLQNYFNYVFITLQTLKHKKDTYNKPDILPILSSNSIQKARPDLQLWSEKMITDGPCMRQPRVDPAFAYMSSICFFFLNNM